MSDELDNILETKPNKPENNSGYSNTNVEESLAAWGMGFLVVGIIAGLICIFASGVVTKKYSFEKWGENGIAWYLVLAGVGVALQGMFVQVLLKGGAEIIRLLRKLNSK